MVNNQNYQELIQKVTMYLDNELNKDAERDLLLEMQQNPDFNELLRKERYFKEFIKSKVNRRTVSPDLIKTIMEKIR
jgi:hypothetical protein